MKSKKCIFCRKTEADFDNNNSWSVEHIIPLSLGNTQLKSNDVCKDCNNKLGQNVDNYFVNFMLIAIKRKELKLKGESGKIPNPFKSGVDQYGNKVRVNDSLEVSLVPIIKPEQMTNGIHITGNANSVDEAKKEISKILKKRGYSNEEITSINNNLENNLSTHSYQPKITYPFIIDYNRIALFMLKIAYEYTCLKLGENYYNDSIAIEIRDMLYKAICGEMKEKCGVCRWVSPAPKEIKDVFKHTHNLNLHGVLLHPDKGGKLICEIFLFFEEFTSFSVIVSENAEKYIPLPQTDIIEIKTS